MPTGYTCNIEKGIEFKDFALSCARAFGACVTMRDDSSDTPIPEKFQPSNYHAPKIKKAEKALKELRKITVKDAEALAEKEFSTKMKEYEKYNKEKNKLKQKYEAMLAKVNAWTPPSTDHFEFRKFMADQIKKSIEFDCTIYPCEVKRLTGEKWIKKEKERILWDIDYHAKGYTEEKERVESRNTWVKQLRESLETT